MPTLIPRQLDDTIEAMSQDGADKLHVVADFDKTLTTAFVDGKPMSSIISVLREYDLLDEEYSQEAKELFNHYHPLEYDPAIPFTQRVKTTAERYNKHFELLAQYKLNKSHIQKVIDADIIQLREYAAQVFQLLRQHEIPLIIFSASGMGGDAIPLFLQRHNLLTPNVHVVSNSFIRDENGHAIQRADPLIHSLNKGEIALAGLPIKQEIEHRPNIILLGDSTHDPDMVQGANIHNIIKIGFYNLSDDTLLQEYQKLYDIVITDDGDMEDVLRILKQII